MQNLAFQYLSQLPDIIRGVIGGEFTRIRNPNSKRPWLHVLEPLIGYLNTLEFSLEGKELKNVNFGPDEINLSVREILESVELTFPNIRKNMIIAEDNETQKVLRVSHFR